MPAGVTRFIIDNRLLNLGIPLSLLLDKEFNDKLWDKLIHQWNKSLRLYTTPVYVCEY